MFRLRHNLSLTRQELVREAFVTRCEALRSTIVQLAARASIPPPRVDVLASTSRSHSPVTTDGAQLVGEGDFLNVRRLVLAGGSALLPTGPQVISAGGKHDHHARSSWKRFVIVRLYSRLQSDI